MHSIFSKIVDKQIPSYIIYEDDLVMAFLDISQVTRGHTLVITKKVYADIQDVPQDVFLHLFKIVYQISHVLIKAFKASGLNLINNNGSVAGQTIFHYHVHIIPRFSKDEIYVKLLDNSSYLREQDYKTILKQIIDYNCN
ncbi:MULTISPECIES: HIT family protein [Candidatus Phytoplasma]|uniref:Diadenosine tetraphosphate hydrolase n=2 Tax=Candidatus Phytoplasma TaxID=33926 RepID=A0ABN0J864_PEWBP|nr:MULTISPECIES: HIT family protein [Phytoplasma]QLL36706.1 diadenosine tetraphosphate hydrolase ['Echinacea purpurea' witches'-broom phytoplasma]WEX20194.1 MAG: HIT family hydrolase [Candidatus Phytoplasma aurantifolia]WKV63950.1 MAG: diadenosine tetraphosphate hydrolase [Candidatus Phytoplasma australasiaticum]EMR14657.1 diadenosine tetraphosphate hydrolase [Peanut witches'-broom phytoplasma NTU2011]MDO8052878.1 HIT family protein ['Vigna radiata' phytoplasma]